MNKYLRRSILIFTIALPFAQAAFAHDPLHESHDQAHALHRTDIGPAPAAHINEGVDLAAIRELVISFRETGDDSSLEAAWRILEPVLDSDSIQPDVLVSAAFVAQSRHEFDYALQLLDKALAGNGINDEAWLLRASISLVRGDTAAAAHACGQLRRAIPLVLIACSARVLGAGGENQRALATLQGVLNVVNANHIPRDLLAWSYSVAGDLASGADQPERAVELYVQSLALAERTQVRAAFVDVLISRSDFESAWQALGAGEPALPLLVRRFIVARQLDGVDAFQSQLATVQREFEDWIREEDWLHAREMARFYIDVVDRPLLARKLALINIGLQREPEDKHLEIRTRS